MTDTTFNHNGNEYNNSEFAVIKRMMKCNNKHNVIDGLGLYEINKDWATKCGWQDAVVSLADKGYVTFNGTVAKLSHKRFTGMFSPTNSPIEPGVRRPNTTGSIEQTAETPVKALKSSAKQGLVVNAAVAAKVDEAFASETWNSNMPAEVLSAIRVTAKNIGKTWYNDAWFDFRGRLYSQSGSWLTLLTNKGARAMMDAPEASEVDAKNKAYTYVILEAEHGVTINNYREVLERPLTSKNDLMAFRAAEAIREIEETGQSAHLVEQDASCSGGQIIALLTGDAELARATNCIKREGRGDIYLDICERPEFDALWTAASMHGEENKKTRRQLAKGVIMVSFYGGAEKAIISSLWENNDGTFNADGEPQGEIKIDGFTFNVTGISGIVRQLKSAVDAMPGFKAMLSWGQSTGAAIVNNLDGTFEWTSASGFIASGRNLSAAGFMPNFVHSIDGAIVQTAQNLRGDMPLYTIHDAFLTTPGNVLKCKKVITAAYKIVLAKTEFPNVGKTTFPVDLCLVDGLSDAMIIGEPVNTISERRTVAA